MYVTNSPLVFSDATGLCLDGCIGEAIAIQQIIASILATAATIQAASDATKALTKSKDQCQDPCDKLIQQIRDHIKGMKDKYNDLLDDKHDLYNRARTSNPGGDLAGKGTWQGHIERFKGLVEGLKNLIGKAASMGCKIPDDLINEIKQWLGCKPPASPK